MAARTSGATERLPSLTSLRWFAASAVFLRHGLLVMQGGSDAVLDAYRQVAPQGATGVSFFFILSGFVLAWSRRPGDTVRGFYRRRFARVGPAYLVLCVVAFANRSGLRGENDLLGLVTNIFPVTFLQSWVPDSRWYYGGSGVAWSLSDEMFFYALFPFAIGLLLRLERRAIAAVLGAVVAAAIALPLVLHPTVESQGLAFWAIYIDPVYRLLEFVAGICLCALLRDGVRLRVRPGAAALLAVAAYVVAGHVPLYAMWVAVTVVPFCILIFACAQADVTGYRGVLHHPWLIRLGQWSYAFYLVHTLVIRATAHANGIWASDAWRLLIVAASYGVTIVVAYALFRFVEHPLERRIRRGGTATPQSEVALAR